MDYYRKIAKSIDELKLKFQLSVFLWKIQENSDKLNKIKTDIESNYHNIGDLELNIDKNKADISTNNEKITNITKSITENTNKLNGNYVIGFIDNKILNIVYTKYIFKNIAGHNNHYMIHDSFSQYNFKKFSYINLD